jgi:hypothetical protein
MSSRDLVASGRLDKKVSDHEISIMKIIEQKQPSISKAFLDRPHKPNKRT